MSGPAQDIPEELHILAGEYVLGVLDASEMQAVRRRVRVDPALAAAIAAWERRLAPLANVVPPEQPPAALWTRLERATAEEPPATEPVVPRRADVVPLVPRQPAAAPPRRRVWPWQLATAASLALAAGIAALALLPSDLLPSGMPRLNPMAQPQRIAALIPADGKATGSFLARTRSDGTVVLTALSTVAVPAGRDLELWILRPGAKAPTSLGVMAAIGKTVTLISLPPEGTQLMVSLEPPGGSPTGQPTGPVLYAGALATIAL